MRNTSDPNWMIPIFRRVANRDTAYEPLQHLWTASDPLAEHCGAVAHVVQSFYDGDILSGKDKSGTRWLWNRLPDGREVSLTAWLDPEIRGKVMPKRKTINPRFALFESLVRAQTIFDRDYGDFISVGLLMDLKPKYKDPLSLSLTEINAIKSMVKAICYYNGK